MLTATFGSQSNRLWMTVAVWCELASDQGFARIPYLRIPYQGRSAAQGSTT